MKKFSILPYMGGEQGTIPTLSPLYNVVPKISSL